MIARRLGNIQKNVQVVDSMKKSFFSFIVPMFYVPSNCLAIKLFVTIKGYFAMALMAYEVKRLIYHVGRYD